MINDGLSRVGYKYAHGENQQIFLEGNGSSSSRRHGYYLGGIIALLLQDHHTMSTKSVCSNQYMVTDQH